MIHGNFDPRFTRVRDALAANLASGADIGASVAVCIDGEFVVDIWGGHLDKERTQPWQRDTIVNTFSTTKTMTALCALILADRGELDLAAPVARYWPEFAQNGKARTEVRHLLGHSAGLPGWTDTSSTAASTSAASTSSSPPTTRSRAASSGLSLSGPVGHRP
jgi:CubicO group peptidase (beta-lactamase class C family)